VSERDEILERLARAQIELEEAQENFDSAAAYAESFDNRRPEPEATDETEPPA
jgi:hypothetical protein